MFGVSKKVPTFLQVLPTLGTAAFAPLTMEVARKVETIINERYLRIRQDYHGAFCYTLKINKGGLFWPNGRVGRSESFAQTISANDELCDRLPSSGNMKLVL